ncbi:MAG: YIP1 family protein [Desulfatiglandales bacterium]
MERIKGFLFSPSKTFDASKEDTIGDAFKYFLVILTINAVLSAIIAAVTFSLIRELFGTFMPPETPPFGAEIGPMFAVIFFIFALVGGIIVIFIGGLWLHIWVYLLGGRNGVGETLKAVMYGETPSRLLGWIPIIGIIALIWTFIVDIIGVRQLHELSTGKAVLAVILEIIIAAIIISAIIAAFIASLPEPVFPVPPTGFGFGGYSLSSFYFLP